jgi:hypothetical protein
MDSAATAAMAAGASVEAARVLARSTLHPT